MRKRYHFENTADALSIEYLASKRLTRNINDIHTESFSLGDRMADKMAEFAGSWTFITIFASIMFVWIIINSVQWVFHPFDPYPYILLNLVLSCIAAIQAPIIMMSQNRQEEKDRIRAEHDYHVNLKAEILIEEIIIRLQRIEEQQKNCSEQQQILLERLAALEKKQ